MGEYGAIYAWQDGFLYPLGWQTGWHIITFTYGNVQGTGLLDFQYISWTNQKDNIGKPKFWTKSFTPSYSDLFYVEDASAIAGSKWTSDPGRLLRQISSGIRVRLNTNAQGSSIFYPAPQEAEVSLILDWLDPSLHAGVPQDIGVTLNLTYTYFIEGSVTYGMPIWFEAQSILVRLTEQGNSFYMPNPSLIFNEQSDRSFIDPTWKVASSAGGMLINFAITPALYYEFGPAGALTGIILAATSSQLYNFNTSQQLISVTEDTGTATCRNFTYTDWFKTAEKQEPLSKPIRSICEGFFFRVMPTSPSHCGSFSIDLKGNLLPFFYKNPEYEAGTWIPWPVEIQMRFPTFITD